MAIGAHPKCRFRGYVASGRLDGYYERGIWPWDLAAGSVILEEAGGKLTDYRGGVLDLDGREIVASNGRLHPSIVRLMEDDDR
jgi:myo-inositol-1(or 4)-monophosphatase